MKKSNESTFYSLMERESDYDNDGLDPSEEYFRKKKKSNDDDTYFPPEESEPPHYRQLILRNRLPPNFAYQISTITHFLSSTISTTTIFDIK